MTRIIPAIAVAMSLACAGLPSDAKAEEALWSHVFGGKKGEGIYDLVPTKDGGVAVAAYTWSGGGGKADAWLLGMNADGNTILNKILGGKKSDEIVRVAAMPDGRLLAAGYTRSESSKGGRAWWVQLDGKGKKVAEWLDAEGQDSSLQDFAFLPDGGWVTTGSRWGGLKDKWLLWVSRFDSQGKQLWAKSYGGKEFDHGGGVVALADGSFAVLGSTQSKGAGSNDLWLLKLDADGNKVWDRTFGGPKADLGQSLHAVADGGLIVIGHTGSKGAGEADGWIMKLAADGALVWEKTIGTPDYEWLMDGAVLKDGSIIAVGSTRPQKGGEKSAFIVRLDKDGTVLWQQRIGGKGSAVFNAVALLADGRLTIGGSIAKDGKGNEAWLFTMRDDGTLPATVKPNVTN